MTCDDYKRQVADILETFKMKMDAAGISYSHKIIVWFWDTYTVSDDTSQKKSYIDKLKELNSQLGVYHRYLIQKQKDDLRKARTLGAKQK